MTSKIRLHLFDRFADPLHIRLAQHVQMLRQRQPIGPQLRLAGRFFAGNIQHLQPCMASECDSLQQQRRFADARIAADKNERSRHDPAAEHAVEFAQVRRDRGSSPLFQYL